MSLTTETVTQPKEKRETELIRSLIEQRLKTRLADESSTVSTAHLDEDAICAFVEARLDEAESLPIISHLVACESCRQTTARLIRLESRFDEDSVGASVSEGSGRVRQLLERLAADLTPSFEEEVFGYESPPEELELKATDQTTPDESKD